MAIRRARHGMELQEMRRINYTISFIRPNRSGVWTGPESLFRGSRVALLPLQICFGSHSPVATLQP